MLQFKVSLDRVRMSFLWFIFISLMIVLSCDIWFVRWTGLNILLMPQIPNISTYDKVCYWCYNWRLASANVPRFEPDTPEEYDTPGDHESITSLYYQLLGQPHGLLRNGFIIIATAYDSTKGSSLCLKFEYMRGDYVLQNCKCNENLRILDQSWTLVSGSSWSDNGLNWVCCGW